jgi:hypothetical protein
MERGHKKTIAVAQSTIVLVDRMQARDSLRTRPAGSLASKGGGFRAWASFRASDGLLLSAVFVLAAARGLRRLRLIGPAGILTAIRLSQCLVQSGMRIWRQESGMARGRRR